MLDFMQSGGYAMWIILVLGCTALGLALSFATHPTERKLAIFRPLSVSTLFLSLSGLCAGLGTTMKTIVTEPQFAKSPDIHLWVMTGIGESLANAILGFSLLGLAWLFTAVGMRRQV